MRKYITPLVAGLALAVFLTACGASADTAEEGPTVTTAPTTSAGPTTSASAATTTTAPTTSTTRAPDAHPVWPRTWAEVWPADGAEATYQVLTYDDETIEVPARIDYAVPWEGGTWDRLTVGTADFGGEGAAFYFDRSEPWVIRWWGTESFFADMPEGQVQREWLAEPVAVDLGEFPDAALSLEGTMNLSFFRDMEPELQFSFSTTGQVAGIETIVVPAGEIERALHITFTVGGEFGGEPGHPSDMWIHPEWFLVKWEDTFGFRTIELATPWE